MTRSLLIVLQLYYNKRSQFVSGVEAEKVEVSVGQKVRLSNLSATKFANTSYRQSTNG